MSTRIRYKKTNDDGILKSVRDFTNKNGISYYVKLNTVDRTFEIRYKENQQIVKGGGEKINNLNVLKRTIKKELKSLGVEFGDDVRNRDFGLCKKGYTQQKHIGDEPNKENEILKEFGL